jgi:hypothetical protein
MTFLTHPWLRSLIVGSTVATLALTTGLSLAALAQAPSPTEPDAEETENPESTTEPTEPTGEDTSATPTESVSSFACQLHNGRPTVMYAPSSQPGQMYPWAVPQDMGTAWPAQRRCEAISARLESYRPDGLLTLDTGLENGYNTVCVTTEAVPGCRIVFTVPPGQNPTLTRDQVFGNLASADQGQVTEGVNTFVGGSNDVFGQIGQVLGLPSTATMPSRSGSAIDLKPFLAPADGGTGTRLTGGASGSGVPGRSLNPDNFR